MDNNNESDSEYEIKQEIGKGNFGKVLLGISKKTGEKVAIKIINKLKMSKRYNSEQIKREINVIKQMDHLNIVKIYKIENDVKKYKITMEYCEKGELYEYIVKKRRLNEDESACYYFQLINGVEFMHSKNIVHRDLKPENLLINKKNILKIIDFGLSNYHNINKLLSTPCGSPSYASPEMVSGKRYNGMLVDIWCTGIILFAMLCGYLPFEANDNYSLFKKIIKCEIKYPSDLSNISLDLMKKILVNDPSKRITIPEIKKHPFYLKGKKVFGRMHKEYLEYVDNSLLLKNNGSFNENKKYKKKKINLIKNKNSEKINNIYNSNTNINKLNLKYKKTIDDSMNKNILCFNISIDKNNKRKVFDDEYFFNKEKIFHKKYISKKKPITHQNSLAKNSSDEIIKCIKSNMSPVDTNKKIKFKEKFFGPSIKKGKNLNLNYSGKNFYFKTLKYNNSPRNSLGPYKRPTLKERSISVKKVKYSNGLINPIKTITSSINSIKKNNMILNRMSGKNSVIINKLFHIKNSGKNNKLINSLYVYKHKTLNKSEIKDNNKYIYEKKHQISKNSLDKNIGRNNSNDLNIYYTLGNSQTKKKHNIKSKIIYLSDLNKNIFNNYKKRNTYTNIIINPVQKYISNNPNISNQRKNDDKIYNRIIYGKTIDTPQKINEYNFINENFLKINNHQKDFDYNKSIVSIPNNKKMIKLLNSQQHLLFKGPIQKEESLNTKSAITLAGNNKIIPKPRFNAVILNNQINQLNIYKNDNSINAYNANSINFYDNSDILKTEENELNRKNAYKGRNEFNTIIVNKRYETENNDFQSISFNANRIKRKLYKPILNKNALKNIPINKYKMKRQKLNFGNTLNLKEDNQKIIIRNKNKNKLILGDNNSSLIDKKSKDNNLPISIKFENINNEKIIKKKKDYFKKNNVLNIHY